MMIYGKTTICHPFSYSCSFLWSNFPKFFFSKVAFFFFIKNKPEGILPDHSFFVQLYRFPVHKHNTKSCHGGVSGLHSYQEFGKIPDHLPQTPSVHSSEKISDSNASNRPIGQRATPSVFSLDIPMPFSENIFKVLYIINLQWYTAITSS